MTAIDLTKKAQVVLDKYGDDVFEKAELYLSIDRSGSMRPYYDDPSQPVVKLAKQVLALGLARLDPDGEIPMWFFSSGAQGPWTVTQENLYPNPRRFGKGVPADIVTDTARKAREGSTNLTAAIIEIVNAHIGTGLGTPGLAIVQTDGYPDNPATTKQALAEASKYNLFFVFVGYGKGSRRFLDECDAGGWSGQVVDNVAAFYAGNRPAQLADEDVFEALVKDIPQWRRDARGKVQGAV